MSNTALFEHCTKVYAAMEKKSVLKQHDTGNVRVYEGFLTNLFKSLNLSVPYYTSVMRELKRMGCVQQLRRGGSTTASQWALLGKPTQEVFDVDPPKTPGQKREDRLMQMIGDLNKRVVELEQERAM